MMVERDVISKKKKFQDLIKISCDSVKASASKQIKYRVQNAKSYLNILKKISRRINFSRFGQFGSKKGNLLWRFWPKSAKFTKISSREN